jgi:hypothetical protein
MRDLVKAKAPARAHCATCVRRRIPSLRHAGMQKKLSWRDDRRRSATRDVMKTNVLLLLATMAACAGSEPPAETPSSAQPARSSGATSPQAADDPARILTAPECESLGQWIAEACASQPHTRLAKIDSWCGDIVRTVDDGTWVTDDCTKHVRYMDAVCFRSTRMVRALMDCDRSVDRP